MLTTEVIDLLAGTDFSKTSIFAVGNTWKMDEGIAHFIVDGIKDKEKFMFVIDSLDRPEINIANFAKQKPPVTIIITAAEFKGEAGVAKLIPLDLVGDLKFSTNSFPIKVIADIIKGESEGEVYFIAIQSRNLKFGNTISPEVKKTGEEILDIINNRK